MLLDTSCIHLSPSTCVLYWRQNYFVCCRIQRDTSRPWYKWIVIMSPIYSLQVSRTSNMYPATDIRRQLCIRIQVARPRYMFPGDMFWCKRGVRLQMITCIMTCVDTCYFTCFWFFIVWLHGIFGIPETYIIWFKLWFYLICDLPITVRGRLEPPTPPLDMRIRCILIIIFISCLFVDS